MFFSGIVLLQSWTEYLAKFSVSPFNVGSIIHGACFTTPTLDGTFIGANFPTVLSKIAANNNNYYIATMIIIIIAIINIAIIARLNRAQYETHAGFM